MTLDVVVLLSGTGSNLLALLQAAQTDSSYRVVAALADRPAAGLQHAAAHGVPTAVIAPVDYPDRAAWAAALAAKIESYGVNGSTGLTVSAGLMRILPPAFVAQFSPRLINTHPSLLPLYPGANAVAQTLAAGAHTTGVTVHQIDAGVDTGPVLAQRAIPVHSEDTVQTLHERIKEQERQLLPQVVHEISTGALPLV